MELWLCKFSTLMCQVISILWPHCCALFPCDNKVLFVFHRVHITWNSHRLINNTFTRKQWEEKLWQFYRLHKVTQKSNKQIIKQLILWCKRNVILIQSLRGTSWLLFIGFVLDCVQRMCVNEKEKKRLKFNARWFGLELRQKEESSLGDNLWFWATVQ